MNKISLTKEELKYIKLLSKDYPSIQSACTEIINLQAIMQLPKGTEHFMSDLHGEYEAFTHILNNASGVIKTKIDMLFSKSVSPKERSELASLIYYTKEKLPIIKKEHNDYNDFCRLTLYRLIDVCHLVASKYTRSKVRKALPKDFSYIIDELLNADYSEHNRENYYGEIVDTIIQLDRAEEFIIALSDLIKYLAVDRLHIVGDIFDRGTRPDVIIDMLMEHHDVDIQWGNHDVLWIGAASGHLACIAIVIAICIKYGNLEVLEMAYGINLRPLALFAQETYKTSENFFPKEVNNNDISTDNDASLLSKILKAITIIQFKIEGQIIKENPYYDMKDRLFLDKINLEDNTVTINDIVYPLSDTDFPTLNINSPYELTKEEENVMQSLKSAFLYSEKLQEHIKFLIECGGMYKCYNGNLLYHGCIPLKENGDFDELIVKDKSLKGKAMLDKIDLTIREAFYHIGDNDNIKNSMNFIWYLWCGKKSPLFGRDRMTSFERALIKNKDLYAEPKNHYYKYMNDETVCVNILK